MNPRELGKALKAKYLGARKALKREGADLKTIDHTGCMIVAFDGLLRGAFLQDVYEAHLREHVEGRGFSSDNVINTVLGAANVLRDVLGDKCRKDTGAWFYSSSPKSTGREDLIPQLISRRQALLLADDIRRNRTLGVIIVT